METASDQVTLACPWIATAPLSLSCFTQHVIFLCPNCQRSSPTYLIYFRPYGEDGEIFESSLPCKALLYESDSLLNLSPQLWSPMSHLLIFTPSCQHTVGILEFGDDDELSPQWTSWLIPMFVVANVTVFFVTMFVNNCPKNSESRDPNQQCVARFLGRFSFEHLRNNPLFGPSSLTLEKLGSLDWYRVVEKHHAWRLLTCIWLHAGVIHLATNMLSIVFIGTRLEQQFGFVRIGVIYVMSGLGGSIPSSLFIRNCISVGASGALFGLLGSMLSNLSPTGLSTLTSKTAAFLTLLVVTVINLAIGILPYADNLTHVGGFLTGFLLGFLQARPRIKWFAREHMPQGGRTYKYKPYQYILWLLSLALLIVGFVVASVLLFKGEDGNDHCHWCRYMRCIPTSGWSCDTV